MGCCSLLQGIFPTNIWLYINLRSLSNCIGEKMVPNLLSLILKWMESMNGKKRERTERQEDKWEEKGE